MKIGSMIGRLENALAPSRRLAAAVDSIFRIGTSLIFIVGGLGHFGRHGEMLARIDESPWRDAVMLVGSPSILLWLSGGVFVIFGFMLALGYATRTSAMLLFAALVPITIAVHVAPGHTGPFLKNIAILGSLLHFYARGPGCFAIDSRSQAKAASPCSNPSTQ
ncbi:DoxX family protein [Tardiphaga sp.]|uniref:DoxX family protein n=1 Tax=Tardiphaga sp. TaxID=1926292 RepID=UPI00352A52D8